MIECKNLKGGYHLQSGKFQMFGSRS